METSSDDASGSGGSRVTDALDRLTRRLRDVVPAAFDPQDPGDEPAPEAAGPLVPPALLKLQRYVVLAPLGRGGMGMVYLAHSRSLPDRQVALKVLPQAFSMDPKRLARFRNEATTASRIDHVGVARVLEIGEEAGIHFLVQELVPDGRTLADRIREARDAKTLPRSWYREVARIFASVAHAMAAVHASNVLHRDLKPSNILLLPNGEPKVADFGLAKDLEAAGGMSGPASPGTLNYKSPEQVDGRNGPVTERSDVFALGATLYEALMFAQLFPGDDPAEVQPMILHREVEDLRLQRPSVPKDLSVICRKCLEKEPSRRFAAMAEVAAELERHLRDEPILATEPGWVERAWKWRRRHPAASATMAVTTLALGVVSVFAWKLDATASAEALAKAEAQRSIENFEQLSGVLRLEELVASKHSLWPLGPVQVPALVTWLEEASKLLALRPRVEETIAELRTTAVPMTVRLSELEQRKDGAWNDLVEQRRVVGSLRRAEAIRTGKQPLELPPVDGSMLNMRPRFLEALAWPAIAPARPMLSFSTSQGLRGEALALTVARLAASLPLGSGDAHRVMDTLAWAELANGQDEEAIRVSAHALAIAPLHERPTYARYHKEVKQAVTEAPQRLVAAESRLATLEARVATRTTWSFPRDSAGDSARVLHDDLVELLVGLEALENLHMPDVAERQRWSEQVDAATARHPRARTTWDQARAAVTRADGTTASTRYSGTQIDIPALGWPGLVPIGMNPVTRLWEFYDLWTAWDGRCELGEIPIPCHRADGSLELEGDLGVVFVLLPGGTVQLGAQDLSPGLPLYDPQPGVETMLRDAHLPPFLVARHELTEAQWGRLERDVPAPPNPWEQLLEGLPLDGSTKLGGMRPASGQDGATFLAALKRHGMELPTEDQWEHACRGGGITPWQVHLEALHTHANLASTELYGHSDNGMPMPSRIGDDAEDWSDGFLFTAPVGSLLPNDYGLHDMHGNVAEWCVPRAFGGLPRIRGSEAGEDGSVRYFVLRGGSFHDPARRARSGHRSTYADTSALATCGARPVRLVPPYHQ